MWRRLCDEVCVKRTVTLVLGIVCSCLLRGYLNMGYEHSANIFEALFAFILRS